MKTAFGSTGRAWAAAVFAVVAMAVGAAAQAPEILYQLPGAYAGEPYEGLVGVEGSNITWSLVSSLPGWATWEPFSECGAGYDCMVITGTPTTEGNYTFTVKANSATKELTIRVKNPGEPIISAATPV